MTAPARRNACPTIARPMETGDGLLARLPPAGPLAIACMAAVVEAARRHGNGRVEVSARGSLQVRGLSSATTTPFAAALAAVGLRDTLPAIHAPPLAGREGGDSAALVAFRDALSAAVAAAGLGPRLAPKLSVVIDGPGHLHLDALDADLRVFLAEGRATLSLGGDAARARPVGSVPAARAAEAARLVLSRLAALGPAARGRDLDAVAVAEAVAAAPAPPIPRRAPASFPGVHPLAGGRVAVGLGLPFGAADADGIAALLAAATAAGASHVAPAPERTLLVIGLPAAAATRFRGEASRLGFISDAADPRRSVAACAGAPACASGHMAARGIADAATAAARSILDGSVTLHLAGCAKGCARPGPATLALVGTAGGLALAVGGRAEAARATGLPATDAIAALGRLDRAVAGARHGGETAAETIARLRAERLAGVLHREPADA